VTSTSRAKSTALGGVVLVVMGLAACGSAPDSGSSSAAGAAPAATPRQVIPKSVGSPSAQGRKGPVVISNPVPLPGGKISSQKVVLSDRTLVINSVTKLRGKNQGSTLIDLQLVVRNTGVKAIGNESTFFQLMGPGGDIFGYQDNSSDDFYRTIDAHASRSGMIEFAIPAAAASSLSLLYRPEVAAETLLIRLKVG
jgi:hypothetical protein